jgi:hypothetical protein
MKIYLERVYDHLLDLRLKFIKLKKMSKDNRLVVAALDFGTTYSSWAFSLTHEYQRDPIKVTAKQWYGLESAVSLKGKVKLPNMMKLYL